MNTFSRLLSFALILALSSAALSQSPQSPFPVKRTESAETWRSGGWAAIDAAKRVKRRKKAKNVILFIGDGMGIPTLTAARIFEGQERGESGEENRLSFELFPYTALSKTYSVNQQVPDSASTMSAIMTGIKTDQKTLAVNQNIVHSDYRTVAGNETTTLLELAEDAGKSTGVVTTTRLTHATPAACYAHSADRDWESDADIASRKKDAADAKFPDIARQLLEFKHGDGLEVAMGGGRDRFLPKTTSVGVRLDGRDLTAEWLKQYPASQYVSNRQQLAAVDPAKTKHLLGLFNTTALEFTKDRIDKNLDEPTLTEMTTTAIDVVSRNKKGYFLMVEGGRIDEAHHYGNAYRALSEAVEFSNAVRAAVSKVNLDETLIIVTADHSHALTIMGYPARGNNILGLVRDLDANGDLEPGYKLDKTGKPYTTLNYTNGRGYPGESANQPEGPKSYPVKAGPVKSATQGRPDLTKVDTTNPNYEQEAMIPLADETHGGEDVAIFAIGPNAHLIRGSMEQNWIFYVMADALRLGRK